MTKVEKQILLNQIDIMGMLQNMQDELEPVQGLQETHDLIISERNVENQDVIREVENV